MAGWKNSLKPAAKKSAGGLRCAVVIPAAGSSTRMGFDKLTLMLEGVPVLVRAANAFEHTPFVEEIVIVTRSDRLEEAAEMCRQYSLSKVSAVVVGGENRTASVFAGVMALKSDCPLIAVHDGARPFVTGELITACAEQASMQHAAVPVLRIPDSLRELNEKGELAGGLDRDRIVRVQTPQVFQADLLKAALTEASKRGLSLTDEAGAMELLRVKLQAVEGEEDNIKLTGPDDLTMAEAILKKRGARA